MRRIPQAQLRYDVLPHPFRSGGGERHHRRVGKPRPQLGKGAVVGPEIVPPFADAVGFVNGNQPQVQRFQETAKAVHRRPFRRHIKQADGAGAGLPLRCGGGGGILTAVEEGGGDAVGAQRRHLVLHQRNQRRHHQRQPAGNQRRQLVAQRLAAAGRHHHQAVPPGQGVGNHRLLAGAEGVVPEMPFQHTGQVGGGGGSGRHKRTGGGMKTE